MDLSRKAQQIEQRRRRLLAINEEIRINNLAIYAISRQIERDRDER